VRFFGQGCAFVTWLSVLFLASPAAAQEAACSAETEVVRGEKGARLDAFVQGLSSKGFSGVVLVAEKGEILLYKAYGLADRGKSIPNTVNTRFEVASITKVFTAAAVLQLEMQGKLHTDDSLNSQLGEFPQEKAGATIHHLLTHTAGLAKEGAALDGGSREAFIRAMKESPIDSPSGKEYRYTNAGYSLLAGLVERTSGVAFEAYLRKNLFEPTGMHCARFRPEKPAAEIVYAIGYEDKAARDPAPVGAYLWGTRGAGGVITTASDLYRWDRALRGDSILSASAKRKMFMAYVRDEGYGWHVAKTSRGTTTHFRGGGMPGFESEFVRFPNEDAVIIFVINTRQERFRLPLWKGLEEILFSKP